MWNQRWFSSEKVWMCTSCIFHRRDFLSHYWMYKSSQLDKPYTSLTATTAHAVGAHRLQWGLLLLKYVFMKVYVGAARLLCTRTMMSHTPYVSLYQQLAVHHHIDLDDADRTVLRSVKFVSAIMWLIAWRRVIEFVRCGNFKLVNSYVIWRHFSNLYCFE